MKFISDITVGRSMTIETLNTCRQKISTNIKIKILNFFLSNHHRLIQEAP